MKRVSQLNAYFRKKYLVTGVVNGIVAFVCLYATEYVYTDILDWSELPISLGATTFIALLVFGYMLGYFHEQIPHCSSVGSAALRFAGMVFIIVLPVVFLFFDSNSIYDVLLLLDATASIAGIPALVTVFLMYRFAEKSGELPTTCPV